jgi:hypothetical protein
VARANTSVGVSPETILLLLLLLRTVSVDYTAYTYTTYIRVFTVVDGVVLEGVFAGA